MFPLEVVLAAAGIVLAITFLYFTVLRQLEPDSQGSEKRTTKKAADELSDKSPEKPPISPSVSSSKAPDQERKCLHFVGYLAERHKGEPIPDECFGCQQVVKCMKLRPTTAIESYYIDQTTS